MAEEKLDEAANKYPHELYVYVYLDAEACTRLGVCS
jgi:hypothetical protein